jgi:DNA-binding response OmpR family regulator
MSKSILSLNGNKAMNYLLQTIFEKQYDFIPTADVYQSMQCLKTFRNIQTLIVDLDTNPTEAWNLIHHTKSSTLFNVPVILLVSENNDILKQKSYELEIDEIFFKPFNPVDLIAAVNSLMNIEKPISY